MQNNTSKSSKNISQVTQYIIAYGAGEKSALNQVVDGLYVELCQIANRQLHKLNPELISPPELVHEVYLKFSKSLSFNAQNRMHFLAIAAKAMRQLIIDQIKSKSRKKRGGDFHSTTLSDTKLPIADNSIEIMAINQALEKLKKIEPKLVTTIECRYFAGYSEQETAEALGVNVRTVRRYWQRSKKWLFLEMNNDQ